MRILDTEEMKNFKKIFKPYLDRRYDLVADAPKEAVEAYNKYFELFRKISKEEEEALLAEFDDN